MATETVHVQATIAASPEVIYDAWLDGEEHARMTGAGATGFARVGASFTAWDGYIEGTNVELQRGRRIVQEWRASDFPAGAAASRVIVLLDGEGGETRVTIVHTDLPEGTGADFEQGWEDHYLAPMRQHFGATKGSSRSTGKAAARGQRAQPVSRVKQADPGKPARQATPGKPARQANPARPARQAKAVRQGRPTASTTKAAGRATPAKRGPAKRSPSRRS